MKEYLVEKFATGMASNGKLYATLKLRDEGGSIDAKIWDFDETLSHIVSVGRVIAVDGAMGSYQGVPQLKIGRFESSPTSPLKFAKQSALNSDELYKFILDEIDSMVEPLTKAVALSVFQSFTKEEITTAPAAMAVHNNWCGGLIEHTYSMLQTSYNVCLWYKTTYYPQLSIDKVKFGIICHDLGKINEYNIKNTAFPKSAGGYLVNHIILGPALVYNCALQYFSSKNQITTKDDEMEIYHLMHLVAAHHGQIEWGSPVKPATIEAVIVHHLDNLDTKVLHAVKMLEEVDPNNSMLSKYSKIEGVQYVRTDESCETII